MAPWSPAKIITLFGQPGSTGCSNPAPLTGVH
jgi:hypothetical protein